MDANDTKARKSLVRIALNERTKRILTEWMSSLDENFQGIDVSYPELVGWAIERIGPELSKKDLVLIRDRFFDEVKQVEWLAKKLKEAKSKGESVTLAQLLKRGTKSEAVLNAEGIATVR